MLACFFEAVSLVSSVTRILFRAGPMQLLRKRISTPSGSTSIMFGHCGGAHGSSQCVELPGGAAVDLIGA